MRSSNPAMAESLPTRKQRPDVAVEQRDLSIQGVVSARSTSPPYIPSCYFTRSCLAVKLARAKRGPVNHRSCSEPTLANGVFLSFLHRPGRRRLYRRQSSLKASKEVQHRLLIRRAERLEALSHSIGF